MLVTVGQYNSLLLLFISYCALLYLWLNEMTERLHQGQIQPLILLNTPIKSTHTPMYTHIHSREVLDWILWYLDYFIAALHTYLLQLTGRSEKKTNKTNPTANSALPQESNVSKAGPISRELKLDFLSSKYFLCTFRIPHLCWPFRELLEVEASPACLCLPAVLTAMELFWPALC